MDLNARAHFDADRFTLDLSGEKLPTATPALSATAVGILHFLDARPNAKASELMSGVNTVSPSAVRKMIHELMVAGYLDRVNDGSQGKSALYGLSAKGKTYLPRDSK